MSVAAFHFNIMTSSGDLSQQLVKLAMEFWKHLAEGKGLFLPEELELPFEDVVKARSKEPETQIDASNCSYVGNQEFIELGFSDTVGRTRQSNSHGVSNAVSDQFGIGFHKDLDSVSRETQMGLRIDLKLGESSKDAPSVPIKRSRLTSLCSQTPTCQVHGCNKDLSSSKDYYKRHKVCDAHTKTAKVIVKGIEQRFCQQCSRFHLLAEFDDGKRSCRKRLANHNERRRKPPGARFLTSSMRRTSFPFEDMLPTTFPNPSTHEPGKWFGHVKLEDTNMGPNSLLNFRDNTSLGTLDRATGDPDFSHASESSRALSLLSAQPPSHGLSYPSEIKGPSGSYLPESGLADEPNVSNNKRHLPSGQGNMVDLLQLSSHLEMVEKKKNSMH